MGIDRCERLLLNGQQSSFEEKTTPTYLKFVLVVDLHVAAAPITLNLGATKVSFQTQADAPSCADCGSIMVRNGSCYKCLNCGSTSGCS